MKRRVIAAIAAILLAGVGAVVLLGYVGHADQRALAGMQTVSVFMVTAPIPEGTSADALAKLVHLKEMPVMAVAAGAVSDLSTISGQVATTDLQPGEQLLASRFVDPASLAHADDLKIPAGLQQLSVSLDPQRTLGGYLTPGATVGVFLSIPKDDPYPAQTHLVLHKVLVTNVEGGRTAPAPETGADPAGSSGEKVMVTVAVNSHNAETIIYGAEHGTLWLSLEPSDAVVSGTRVVTREETVKK
jgi:pilus assembly protein CpaB